MPGVAARSWIAAVGTPPLQKNASTLPSFSAPADSAALSWCRVMSFRGSSPAAARTRSAMSSVPLPGDPTDTTRPFRSATRLIPLDCADDDVRVVRVQHRQRADAADGAGVLERPASRQRRRQRVDQREREIDLALLHELEVVHRRAGDFGRGLDARNLLRDQPRQRAAVGVVHAAGAAGGDGQILRLSRAAAAGRDASGQSEAMKRRTSQERSSSKSDMTASWIYRMSFRYLIR